MIYILLALSVFGADRFLKGYVDENKKLYEEEKFCNGKLILTKYYNKGAFLNFMEKKPNLVLAASGAVFGIFLMVFAMFLPKRGNKLLKFSMALITGGAFSNLYDRVTKGAVIDYFSIHCEKLKKLKKVIFNIGDVAIFTGAILMIISNIFRKD